MEVAALMVCEGFGERTVNKLLRMGLPGVELSVYQDQWEVLLDLVGEERAFRNGWRDDVEPSLVRIRDPHVRSRAAVQIADELRGVALEQARSCVMVATSHAAGKYMEAQS